MIIYGVKSVQIKEKDTTVNCACCGAREALSFQVYSRYFHIFWIPFFSLGRRGRSECKVCKHALSEKEMPEEMKIESDALKVCTRKPWWHFIGLALLIIIVIGLKVWKVWYEKVEPRFIENPRVGDVYIYQVDEDSYSSYKVMSVREDSVEVAPNIYEIEKLSKVYHIDKASNYSVETEVFSRRDLEKMYEQDKIKKIKR